MYHYNYDFWGMNLIWWVVLTNLFIFISVTTYYLLGKKSKKIREHTIFRQVSRQSNSPKKSIDKSIKLVKGGTRDGQH
ncbi:MAG: hypothetical protein EAY81_08875 [Bacteroidetes bacterium]|nr:MAG: hypothetical protein EAY81_08875 [Bacteroidota bacterium]